MNGGNAIRIPTASTFFPEPKRNYPISPRENLMRALRHEKPIWMPNFERSSQMAPAGPNDDQPGAHFADYTDWFGVSRKYTPDQESCTPVGTVIDSVAEWEETVVFPELGELDFSEGSETFARDENLALNTRLNGGVFQRLHALLGFENALVDLISEPKKTRTLLEALADFEIAVFRKAHEVYPYEFMFYHDDWGTARAPFFSVDLFKETILPPTKRIFEAVRETGCVPLSHNCGLVDAFIPFLVEEIGAQGLEIQPINDTLGIVKKYGSRTTLELTRPDPYFFFDPNTTAAMVREKAREIVDRYGAHENPGAGAGYAFIAPSEEMYNAFDEEIYRYSLEKYRGLQPRQKGE